jgi:hypothetical protein
MPRARQQQNDKTYSYDVITDRPLGHTHGLPETYGHPNIEVRLQVSTHDRSKCLAIAVLAIKDGHRFEVGEECNHVYNVPVRVVERRESGRKVLRIIFPDPDGGRFPDEPGCSPEWQAQLIQDPDE